MAETRSLAAPITSGVPRTSMPSATKAAGAGSGRASSRPRAAIFADSTSGWSNGLMPSRRPATAVAYSHTSSCAPRLPDTRISPVSWWLKIWSPASSTRRTTCRSARSAASSGASVVEHDGQDAGALLAGGLGDELLGPVGESDDVRAVGDDRELVAQRRRGRDRGAEHEPGVLGAVDGERELDRLGLVEDLGDVGAGEPRRDEAERGERRVAAADGRVGVEHAVAGRAGGLVERRAGVGHDDDAGRRVDAGVAERLLVDAALAVGLDGRARLRRDDERRFGEPVGEGGARPGRARSSRAR